MHTITLHGENKILTAKNGELLLDVLVKNGVFLSAPCGGRGTCGKCKVKLVNGSFDGVEADENGDVLACHARVKENVTITLSVGAGTGLNNFLSQELQGDRDGLGIILDIGTTTLALCLVNLKTGEILKKTSALNPQAIYGADVLSRIQACNDGKLDALQKCVLEKTNELIKTLALGQEIKELVVSANTTMLHIFLGVSPKTIGVYPFAPVFTKMQSLKGSKLNLPVENVYLLPSVSGYIGSDISAGVLSCGMHERKGTSLFIDIGTNGEIVLAHDGKLYSASTSAGPAFEGACIECGTGGVNGAVDKVYSNGFELCTHTLGNERARGICGSGLVDAVALMRNEELLDETGAFNEDSESLFSARLAKDRFYLTDSVYLSQKDIRQIQLAKSAISAGIETLLATIGITTDDVERTYLAGGMAYYMNVENAVKIGLIPAKLYKGVQVVGNTALAGARLCLLQERYKEAIQSLVKSIQTVELANSEIFQEKYIANMYFKTIDD